MEDNDLFIEQGMATALQVRQGVDDDSGMPHAKEFNEAAYLPNRRAGAADTDRGSRRRRKRGDYSCH